MEKSRRFTLFYKFSWALIFFWKSRVQRLRQQRSKTKKQQLRQIATVDCCYTTQLPRRFRPSMTQKNGFSLQIKAIFVHSFISSHSHPRTNLTLAFSCLFKLETFIRQKCQDDCNGISITIYKIFLLLILLSLSLWMCVLVCI
jgi:hypothetical protein